MRRTRPASPPVHAHCEQDRYLLPELAQPNTRWVPHARVEYFPDTGHFIQHEQAERVNARLIEFLGTGHL
jgi:pimeloyl-ACP methyl ester carboxylesterase